MNIGLLKGKVAFESPAVIIVEAKKFILTAILSSGAAEHVKRVFRSLIGVLRIISLKRGQAERLAWGAGF